MSGIDVTTFPLEQLRQVFVWNQGDLEGWDWEAFERRMRQPNWTHQGVWRDGPLGLRMIGCVSLELLDAVTVSYHIAFERGAINKRQLRRILVGLGIVMFKHGIQRAEGCIPYDKRAVIRFVQYCGFYFLGCEDEQNIYGMTAQDYFNDPAKWDGMI